MLTTRKNHENMSNLAKLRTLLFVLILAISATSTFADTDILKATCDVCFSESECDNVQCLNRRCVSSEFEYNVCTRNAHSECADCSVDADCKLGKCKYGVCAGSIDTFNTCKAMLEYKMDEAPIYPSAIHTTTDEVLDHATEDNEVLDEEDVGQFGELSVETKYEVGDFIVDDAMGMNVGDAGLKAIGSLSEVASSFRVFGASAADQVEMEEVHGHDEHNEPLYADEEKELEEDMDVHGLAYGEDDYTEPLSAEGEDEAEILEHAYEEDAPTEAVHMSEDNDTDADAVNVVGLAAVPETHSHHDYYEEVGDGHDDEHLKTSEDIELEDHQAHLNEDVKYEKANLESLDKDSLEEVNRAVAEFDEEIKNDTFSDIDEDLHEDAKQEIKEAIESYERDIQEFRLNSLWFWPYYLI